MTTDGKLFANIPRQKTKKDWPVWKFQVTHALKAAEQWEFATGTADASSDGYAAKQEKAFYSIHLQQLDELADQLALERK